MYTAALTISERERLAYISGQAGSEMLLEVEELAAQAEAAEAKFHDLVYGAEHGRSVVDYCDTLREHLEQLTDRLQSIAAAAGASRKCALKTAILADIARATRARIDMQDTLSAIENLLPTAN